MILTNRRTTVRIAIPWGLECPDCDNPVKDWHVEWHSPEDCDNIVRGVGAMECPFCGVGIKLEGFNLDLAENLPLYKRSLKEVEKWIKAQETTLEELLDGESIWRTYDFAS